MCKVFHNILNGRIEWYFERNNIFSPNTVGFRKTRSSLENLAGLVTRILTGFSGNKSTIRGFIDIDSAYNGVEIMTLLAIMDNIGVGTRVCSYLWNFLKLRNL